MKKLGVFIFLLALMSGCAQNQSADNLYGENGIGGDGIRPISNRTDQEPGADTRDHTMDEQNPNFINFEGNRVNNQQDINQAREVIAESGFRPGPIWINGDNIMVTAYQEGMVTRQERTDAEARLHKKLIGALPRYQVEVKIQEDRT